IESYPMRSDHPQLVRFAGRNEIEQTVNLLLSTKRGFADLTWSQQCFEAGQHLKTLMASPKTVKLSSADQARVQRWSASNADLKAWHMTGDVTDDQLIERMTALAERIAN